jgi:iron complex transport system ATP-binding protein
MAKLHVERLSVTAADGSRLVESVSFTVAAGELVAIVGPNGAGKSSLLRALAGIERSNSAIFIDGSAIEQMTPSKRARLIAWLPQNMPPAWPVQVRDAVALGRYAFGAVPGQLSPTDKQSVERALQQCDALHLADRRITTLSGGELGRVHLARLLTTEAEILLADEPVAALDPAHRLLIMERLKTETRTGRSVLVVLHDIALAARWCDRIIAIHDGRIVADGAPADVVTAAFMHDRFGVEATIHIIDGAPIPVITRVAAPVAG